MQSLSSSVNTYVAYLPETFKASTTTTSSSSSSSSSCGIDIDEIDRELGDGGFLANELFIDDDTARAGFHIHSLGREVDTRTSYGIDQEIARIRGCYFASLREDLSIEVEWKAFKERVSILRQVDPEAIDTSLSGLKQAHFDHISWIENRWKDLKVKNPQATFSDLIESISLPLKVSVQFFERVFRGEGLEGIHEKDVLDLPLKNLASALRWNRYGHKLQKAMLNDAFYKKHIDKFMLIEAFQRWPSLGLSVDLPIRVQNDMNQAMNPFRGDRNAKSLIALLERKFLDRTERNATPLGGELLRTLERAEEEYRIAKFYKDSGPLKKFTLDGEVQEIVWSKWKQEVSNFIQEKMKEERGSDIRGPVYEYLTRSTDGLEVDLSDLCNLEFFKQVLQECPGLCQLLAPELNQCDLSQDSYVDMLLLLELPKCKDVLPWQIPQEVQHEIYSYIKSASLEGGILSLFTRNSLSQELFHRLQEALFFKMPVESGQRWLKETWWPQVKPIMRANLCRYLQGGREEVLQIKSRLKQVLEYPDTFAIEAWKNALLPAFLQDLVDTTMDASLRNRLRILLIPEMAQRNKDMALKWAEAAYDIQDPKDVQTWIELFDAVVNASCLVLPALDSVVFGPIDPPEKDPGLYAHLDRDFRQFYLDKVKLVPREAFAACFHRWVALSEALGKSESSAYKEFAIDLATQVLNAIVNLSPPSEEFIEPRSYQLIAAVIIRLGDLLPSGLIDNAKALLRAELDKEAEIGYVPASNRYSHIVEIAICLAIVEKVDEASLFGKAAIDWLEQSQKTGLESFFRLHADYLFQAVQLIKKDDSSEKDENCQEILIDMAVANLRAWKDKKERFKRGLELLNLVKDIPTCSNKVFLGFKEMMEGILLDDQKSQCDELLEFSGNEEIPIPKEVADLISGIYEEFFSTEEKKRSSRSTRLGSAKRKKLDEL